MYVQKGRRKVGLSGNILVKSNNVFDIREDYSLNIQNVRKIYLLFFFQYLSEKSSEVSRNFSRGGGGMIGPKT